MEKQENHITLKEGKKRKKRIIKRLKPGERRLMIEQEKAQDQSRTKAQAREQRISSILQRLGMKR